MPVLAFKESIVFSQPDGVYVFIGADSCAIGLMFMLVRIFFEISSMCCGYSFSGWRLKWNVLFPHGSPPLFIELSMPIKSFDAGCSGHPIELLLALASCSSPEVRTLTLTHLGWVPSVSEDAAGLRLIWVERGHCSIQTHDGHSVLLEPGSACALRRDAQVKVSATASRPMPWLMVVEVPTTGWLQEQLLRVDRVAGLDLWHWNHPEAESLRMLRLVVQDQILAENSREQQQWLAPAAMALIKCAASELINQPGLSPLSALVADRRLGRAISSVLMTEGPLADIDRLAQLCYCARATFTNKFSDLTGDSYLSYLTSWRMNLSSLRFRLQRATVADESARYGYRSEAAFRKTFSRVNGIAPGKVRRALDAGSASTAATTAAKSPAKPLPPVIHVGHHAVPPDLQQLISQVITRL